MDEGEIYRAWKFALDQQAQIVVLAQLNNVPVSEIRAIIRRQRTLSEA